MRYRAFKWARNAFRSQINNTTSLKPLNKAIFKVFTQKMTGYFYNPVTSFTLQILFWLSRMSQYAIFDVNYKWCNIIHSPQYHLLPSYKMYPILQVLLLFQINLPQEQQSCLHLFHPYLHILHG